LGNFPLFSEMPNKNPPFPKRKDPNLETLNLNNGLIPKPKECPTLGNPQKGRKPFILPTSLTKGFQRTFKIESLESKIIEYKKGDR